MVEHCSKNKKILVDCRMINASGIGVYTREIIKELKKYRYLQIELLLQEEQQLPIDVEDIGFKIHYINFSRYSIKNTGGMKHLLNGFDVYFMPSLSIPPLLKKGCLTITTVHDLCPVALRKLFGFKKAVAYWALLLIQLVCSNKIISISRFTAKEINKYYFGLFKSKLYVIGNGIRNIFNSELNSETENSHEEYGICVGNIKPHKNVVPLINYLKTNNINKKIYFIGEINGFSTKINKSLLNDLPENIVFTGRVSDQELHNYYRNASFFIFPSLYEGFGLPLLEAMNYRLPIFASNIDVFKEVAGETINYFDPYTFDALADRINKLKKNKKSIESYARVLQLYSWDNNVASLLRIMNEEDITRK
ncbi:TPA: glycosyltransferase family 4 protein [Escherichia coli]